MAGRSAESPSEPKRERGGFLRSGPLYVGGADVAYTAEKFFAAVCVFSFPDLQPVDRALAEGRVSFPFVPGLLALRELPAIVLAWEKLRIRPDLLLCDAQGTAHPNRFGLACRLGVVLGVATVGCGKSPLVGEHDPVPAHRGARAWLWHEGERVGLVVRTRASVRPLYVSPGHGIGFDESYRVVLHASPHTRLPEPLRAAHHLATLARNAEV